MPTEQTKATGFRPLTGVEIYRIIMSDLAAQGLREDIAKGDVKSASESASFPGYYLRRAQVENAVLKGLKPLIENRRDKEVVEAVVAFNLTEAQLMTEKDLAIPVELMDSIRAAMNKSTDVESRNVNRLRQ